jgi:hypothetical protein
MTIDERQSTNLADVQSGIVKGLDQIQHGRFAEGSGPVVIERVFERAIKKVRRRMSKKSHRAICDAKPNG